jgi:hypothetical protein
MSTYTINVYDMPIKFTKKDGTTIGIDDPTRSTITDSANNIYELTKISICKPLNSSNNTFDIIFQYNDKSTNPKVYIQVPLKIQNVDVDETNAQLIEFMDYVNSTTNNESFSMNLSEIFGTLKNSTTYSVDETNNALIQYNVIYLNITDPSTAEKLFRNLKAVSNITVNPLNIKPAPRNYRKTRDYNPESRDPTRTLPIEVYDNNNKTPKNDTDNKNNIKEEINTNLQIYTTLMIFGIVLGFIIATLYVILILIPDSKLRITRLPKPKGGWSFRKTWNYLRR